MTWIKRLRIIPVIITLTSLVVTYVFWKTNTLPHPYAAFPPPSGGDLEQYENDYSTLISVGGVVDSTQIIAELANVSASNSGEFVTGFFEFQPVGTPFVCDDPGCFDGTYTLISDTDEEYTGTPVTVFVTTTSNIERGVSYHWHANFCTTVSGLGSGTLDCSGWASFGGNDESDVDFRVNALPDTPTGLGPTAYVDGSAGTDTTPSLEFSVSDPDTGDDVQYHIQVDDDSDFSSPVVDYTSAAGTQGAQTFTVGQAVGSGTYTTGSSGQTLALGSYYWRVSTIDPYSNESSYATANSGSIAFIIEQVSDTTSPPAVTLLAPSEKEYTSNQRPQFRWKAPAETSDVSHYKLVIGNGQAGGNFTVDNIPKSGSEDVVTSKYRVSYKNFSDSDSSNDEVGIYTTSTSDWGSGSNDGKVREGSRDWEVSSVDSAGNATPQKWSFYVDRSLPTLSNLNILGAFLIGEQYVLSSRNTTVTGTVTDPLASEGGFENERIASGPKQVEITLEHMFFTFSDTTQVSKNTVDLTEKRWESDGSLIQDNKQNTANKYADFSYGLPSNLLPGIYHITVRGIDEAGNRSGPAVLLMSVGAAATPLPPETPPPTPLPTPIPGFPPTPLLPSPSPSPVPTVSLITSPSPSPRPQEQEPEQSLGDTILKVIDISVDAIEKLRESEAIQEVAGASTTVTSLAAGGIAGTLLATSSLSLLESLAMAFKMFTSFGLGLFGTSPLGLSVFAGLAGVPPKRRRSTGIIFDSTSFKPISGAYIVFFSGSGNLKTAFSNANGRYTVSAPSDTYKVRVEKTGYVFPSSRITTHSTEDFEHIYLPNEEIELTETPRGDIAIPLDPESEPSFFTVMWTSTKTMVSGISRRVRTPLTIISYPLIGFATIMNPTPLNISLWAFFSIVQAISLVSSIRHHRTVGIVRDSATKKPLGFITVKLYTTENGVEHLHTSAETNKKGEFLLAPENGNYLLRVISQNGRVLFSSNVAITDAHPSISEHILLPAFTPS